MDLIKDRMDKDGFVFCAKMLGVQGENAWSVVDLEVVDLCWGSELGVGGRAR